MRLEFEPNISATVPFVENEVVNHDASAEVENMLREGVRAAQEGRRAEARKLLLGVTERDNDSENAWLWLASISEYPEELLVFLNNVLRVNPQNERALEWHKTTTALMAKTLVQRGMDAASEDRKDFARQCFEQALEHEAENEMAWLWMAAVAGSEEEKTACFEKVLSVNPENETAKNELQKMEAEKTRKMFQDALAAAFDGRHDDAKEMLEAVLSRDEKMENAWALKSHLAASFEERAECFLKLRVLNPENEMSNACLASWRTLADMLDKQSKAEEAFEYAAEAREEFSAEEEIEESSNREVSAKFEDYSDEPEADAQAEFSAESSAAEEFAPAENEMQDSSFDSDYQEDSAGFDEPETAILEVPAPQPDLTAETEAEEAEMHLAFNNSPERAEAEDYFLGGDEEDDIHKTQQANYAEEDFESENFGETNEAAKDEEWRDTSPDVFANYASGMPENEFETPTVQFSYPEDSSLEETETPEGRKEFLEEQVSMNAEAAEETDAEEKASPAKAETLLCPFCSAQNEKQAFSCGACQAVLTLSDLEMLLSQQTADQEKLRQAVESLERENQSYGLNAEQMTSLGIGHVNLKNYRQGFLYLQEAVRMNPSNVVLDAQVNALAIRLSEMEEQQTAQESMPKNRRILVVDDSPTVRKLISGKLEKCGHEVICAVDGVDALEKINDLVPDLVLLDITMPRMDGYQVCKMIRGNEATKDVPVVMISGKDGFFDKVRGRMAGTSGYITKPFGPETLMRTVETYLN